MAAVDQTTGKVFAMIRQACCAPGTAVAGSRAAPVQTDPAGCRAGAAKLTGRRPLTAAALLPVLVASCLVLLLTGCGGPAAGEDGLPDAERFRNALSDPNPSVRVEAVEDLDGRSRAQVIARLEDLKLAMQDPEEAVREAVVERLAGLDHPRAIALLLNARRDRSAVVREDAAEALALATE